MPSLFLKAGYPHYGTTRGLSRSVVTSKHDHRHRFGTLIFYGQKEWFDTNFNWGYEHCVKRIWPFLGPCKNSFYKYSSYLGGYSCT